MSKYQELVHGRTCSDGTHCPDSQTCCPDRHASFACCPLPHATCCSDYDHCCPQGLSCDLSRGTCKRGSSVNKLVRLRIRSLSPTPLINIGRGSPITKRLLEPDPYDECPRSRCCEISGGGCGCCPFPKPSCCPDRLTCCPQGLCCTWFNSTCSLGNCDYVPNRFSVPARKDRESSSFIPCPGHHAYCRNGQTCCEITSGGYGCCPFPNAVCCRDRIHCCPSTQICDLSTLACKTPDRSVSARSIFQSFTSTLPPGPE
ncbi:granulin b [Plakobranchus ocellatus]|uniref:Granulin b n=1 Tax=Plakobranchus ocellatus TaxID=259542 RepID=A0AAV4AYF0_9GAST|nr:granulin b [Plakobranchus ocellatus]